MKRVRWTNEAKIHAVKLFDEHGTRAAAKFLNINEKNAYQNCTRWIAKGIASSSTSNLDILSQIRSLKQTIARGKEAELQLKKITSLVKAS